MHNTQLNDRVLWFDGDSSVDEKFIIDRLANQQSIEHLFVNEITDSVAQYNRNVPIEDRLTVKQQCRKLNFNWNIPEQYKTLDVRQYVIDKLSDECLRVADTLNRQRVQVTLNELNLYESLNLFDLLRALIFIINTLEDKVCWGTGRGSCTSSYVLYLIGVHDVDSVVYDLNITDFLRDE